MRLGTLLLLIIFELSAISGSALLVVPKSISVAYGSAHIRSLVLLLSLDMLQSHVSISSNTTL